MIGVTAATEISPRTGLQFNRSWPLLLGLAVLAVPTIATLASQYWSSEAGAHGPIVLVTGGWLLWRAIPQFRRYAKPGSPALTALGFAISLPLYIFGRAYDFLALEAVGLYGVGISMLYSEVGFRALQKNWFPILYLGFVVPPPGWLMDDITAPLKLFASTVTTDGLQALGFPIFREGVTLEIANYNLLVEDACSGMNSLTGLVAISLFYIYLLRNASWTHSLILICMVIPIAVVANIIRITILVLLTYYFGDAVAQGFLHQAAGLILFTTSLMLVFVFDHLIARVLRTKDAA